MLQLWLQVFICSYCLALPLGEVESTAVEVTSSHSPQLADWSAVILLKQSRSTLMAFL